MTRPPLVRIPAEWAVDVSEDGSIMITDQAGGDIVAVFPAEIDQWLPALALAFCAITSEAGRLHQIVQQWARYKASVYHETRQHLAGEGAVTLDQRDVTAGQGDA